MGNFQSGSAYSMVQQIAGGYILVTERSFKRLQRGELDQLSLEIDKLLRSIRGEPQPSDNQEIQNRNRRLQRLSSCRTMLASYRQRRKI